ncbi:MAG: 2Fe-2S iron-sulfur cluster-binding protein [Vicinamibacterales bacterium]
MVSESSLRAFTDADWASTLEALLPGIHGVDRDATRIWCAFFPPGLADAFDAAADPQSLAGRLRIDGNARLAAGQVDSSHRFLYGHRYWPQVKATILERVGRGGDSGALSLPEMMRNAAAAVALRTRADARLVAGITFVGLMTLRQVGLDAFRASGSGEPAMAAAPPASPDAIVARRERDDGQGALAFLRSTKRFRVVFDEGTHDGAFPILDSQHLTTASAADRRDYMQGPRRFQEGPIPAQCRSATCGTCWVGVLGGREKLSAVEPDEARRLRECGYIDVAEPRPIIRLACQARASGNVTIVIPPWHGFVARTRRAGGQPANA